MTVSAGLKFPRKQEAINQEHCAWDVDMIIPIQSQENVIKFLFYLFFIYFFSFNQESIVYFSPLIKTIAT